MLLHICHLTLPPMLKILIKNVNLVADADAPLLADFNFTDATDKNLDVWFSEWFFSPIANFKNIFVTSFLSFSKTTSTTWILVFSFHLYIIEVFGSRQIYLKILYLFAHTPPFSIAPLSVFVQSYIFLVTAITRFINKNKFLRYLIM